MKTGKMSKPASRRSMALLSAALMLATPAVAQKFFPDDPLLKEPPPMETPFPERRVLSELMEFFSGTFTKPGERHPEVGVIPAAAVNTLGEVMDSPWFTNRHGRKRLTPEELVAGPGAGDPPSMREPWRALTVKSQGLRPGILMSDADNTLYLLRFDPPGNLEMATGAQMISSRIFHALGYNVLENYVVYFDDGQIVPGDGAEGVTSLGELRDLIDDDIDNFLKKVARDPNLGYRAVATRVPDDWEKVLGPFQLYGSRSDDPNDVISHEHRRDLRGLFVISAWLNHPSFQATNTADALVVEDNVPFIRHYLVDFVGTLGSGEGGRRPKLHWEGHERGFKLNRTLRNVGGLGFYTPLYMRAGYPNFPSVGRFDYRSFEADLWMGWQGLAPFANSLPDDRYWAAKQVMAFTEADLRAIVRTARYSDPEAADWIVKCLLERRNNTVQTFLNGVLPLDNFFVEDQQLHFDDLAVREGYVAPRNYRLQWFGFDNMTERETAIGMARQDQTLPPDAEQVAAGTYFGVHITADEPDKPVSVFFRKEASGVKVVGIDRAWPGKVLADSVPEIDTGRSRYDDLDDRARRLFDDYAADFNQRTGNQIPPRDYFDSLSISERTTFDAVTHALINSPLTDEAGNSLGSPIDLVKGIERIAGQYYGRGGDQQFRLYVLLNAGARETLEKSTQFFPGHENTVYHVGYPTSFRQEGKVPNMQFSVSDDGLRADIDVDYRSSKLPQAMFNGHLTSANSDVRAGANAMKHNARWGGFVEWWKELFGSLGDPGESATAASTLSVRPAGPPTPLPPDRAFGAQPATSVEAAQEFLTDWLVRGKIKESMQFFSRQAAACVPVDDEAGDEVLTVEQAAQVVRGLMAEALNRIPDRDNLTEAVEAVLPWEKLERVIDHPFKKEFTQMRLSDETAGIYLCQPLQHPEQLERQPGEPDGFGLFYASLFRFRIQGGGAIGFLWATENGAWKIVAWETFEQ